MRERLAGSRAAPFAVLLALAGLALVVGCGSAETAPTPDRVRVHDSAGLLDAPDRARVEKRLWLLYRQSGIDAHAEFVRGLADEELAAVAARRFASLDIGAGHDEGRGLLLLYDVDGERLRIEVGYGLEGFFPDAFVGYLIHEHARYLFDAGNPADALLLTIRMVEYRIQLAMLGGGFDPSFVRTLRAARYGSGGAGAAEPVGAGRGALEPLARSMPAPWRARFAAGETVEESYQRYLAWLAAGIFEPDLTLFTDETRAFLRGWPMTAAYFDFILIQEYGNLGEILEAGDRAILYSTNDPFKAPVFFRRGPEGWQVDLAASVAELVSIAGGPYSWSFRGREGAYARLFPERLVALDDVLRLEGGDNRTAPVYR